MAFGMRCVKCGWQETDHLEGANPGEGDPSKPFKGFKTSLNKCRNFRPPDQAAEYEEAIAQFGDFDDIYDIEHLKMQDVAGELIYRLKRVFLRRQKQLAGATKGPKKRCPIRKTKKLKKKNSFKPS